MTQPACYISAQPDEPFFVWQTDVYLENFRSRGIPLSKCVALFGVEPGTYPSTGLRELCLKYPLADIRLYNDTRSLEGKAYTPSIQPHLISKALRDSPEWEGPLVFYHDSDIGFLRLPDFESMVREKPGACFLSDTDNYIGYEYLHKCSERMQEEKPDIPEVELILRMCATVGIDIGEVKRRKAGGGQYLLQGVGRPYWDKVYLDSIQLYQLFGQYLGSLGLKKEPKDYLQTWTAGMWAYLWNLWRMGKETIIHPELNFLFPGSPLEEDASIVHMAGLQDELKINHFVKNEWIHCNPVSLIRKYPFLFDHIPRGSASSAYTDMIKQAADMELTERSPAVAAKKWRLLSWHTASESEVWDIQHFDIRFENGESILHCFDSDHAGPAFAPSHALKPDERLWGGRPTKLDGGLSAFFLGIELNRPAIPTSIEITPGPDTKRDRMVILQLQGEDEAWRSVAVARLEPDGKQQRIFYWSGLVRRAPGWRVFTNDTESGFAWDIKRLRLLNSEHECKGRIISSPCAAPLTEAYLARHAFHEQPGYWGGRADAGGGFWLGVESEEMMPVNRIIIEQGDTHFSSSFEVQVKDEQGDWHTIHTATNCTPGKNDLLLFGEEPELPDPEPERLYPGSTGF